MRFRQALLTLNGKTRPLSPNSANTFEEIYADFQMGEGAAGQGTRYSVFLHPKEDVTVQRLEIQFDLPLPPEARFFANGYQSRSESRWRNVSKAIPPLRPLARKRMGAYGDDLLKGIPRGHGNLHSWTYTFITGSPVPGIGPGQNSGILCGSLNEKTGFTLFLYDHSNATLTVRKDMDGLALHHSFPALDFWVGEGEEKALFDHYFRAFGAPQPTPPLFGWTSGRKRGPAVSEAVLLKNLASFSSQFPERLDFSGSSGAYFHLDDGWQTSVGDWLGANPSFPQEGMHHIALKIKEKGLIPSLWVAPFVASQKSELVRRHPEWLLKDPKGRPVKAGWAPKRGGWFHALDFYHEGVREYLSGVFHTVLDKWGFECLKLDFLFAVALAPPIGKTRGGVMWEAMEFLRYLVGTRRIIACGVPLGACFGLADYCCVGWGAPRFWQHPFQSFLRCREQESVLTSLRSVLGRWQLNGRAFLSDPGAFTLGSETPFLRPEQQYTLLVVSALLGALLTTSDDLGRYSDGQKAELEEALSLRGSRVSRVAELEEDVWKIEFEQHSAAWSAYCNLTKNAKKLSLPHNARAELRPYETLVLKA